MEVIMENKASFEFSDKRQIKEFFSRILNMRGIVKIRIFLNEYDFECGIDPQKISDEMDHIGRGKLIKEIPVCDFETGDDMIELRRKGIRKIEILS
jgi:hypothetical protein